MKPINFARVRVSEPFHLIFVRDKSTQTTATLSSAIHASHTCDQRRSIGNLGRARDYCPAHRQSINTSGIADDCRATALMPSFWKTYRSSKTGDIHNEHIHPGESPLQCALGSRLVYPRAGCPSTANTSSKPAGLALMHARSSATTQSPAPDTTLEHRL